VQTHELFAAVLQLVLVLVVLALLLLLLLLLQGHEDSIHAAALSPDEALLATASYDCTTRLWNMKTGQLGKSCSDMLLRPCSSTHLMIDCSTHI